MIALDSQLQQPPATPKVDEWMSRSSRRSSSFLRRSFDAWNGLFSSSHRSSTSAMVSPHKAAQPSAAHAHRQSFASFRRPPKPGKADNMGTSLRQANGYNITKAGAAVHNTAVQPNIGDQPSHRSPSSLPMMRGGNAHPLIPACLQSPAKLSIGPQSQTQSHQQQHRQQHRLHASQYAPTSSAAESLAGVAQPQMQSSILSPYGQQQASVAQAKQQERGLHSNAGQQRLAEVGSIDCIAAAAVSPHEVKRRQPDALQYIQTWLDANPEGHWHPMGDKQGPSVNQPLSGTSPSPDRGALMRKGPLPPKPVSLGDLPQKGKVLPRTRIQVRLQKTCTLLGLSPTDPTPLLHAIMQDSVLQEQLPRSTVHRGIFKVSNKALLL